MPAHTLAARIQMPACATRAVPLVGSVSNSFGHFSGPIMELCQRTETEVPEDELAIDLRGIAGLAQQRLLLVALVTDAMRRKLGRHGARKL